MDEEDQLLADDVVEIPSKTYKVVNGRVVGYADGVEAVRQAIEKVLSTERFAYLIYSEDYGSEITDLIGEQMDLAKSEIERLVTEAVEDDDRVLGVENFEILNETEDSLTIYFEVQTVFGSLNFEQGVTV